MDVKETEIPNELREQAAYWFTRMHSGEIDAQEKNAFHAWHASSALHAHAYRQAEFVWRASAALPEASLRAILAKKETTTSQPFWARRTVGFALGGACAAALLLAIGLGQFSVASPDYTTLLQSAHGQRQQVTLPDGTVAYANTDTEAVIRYYDKRREVELVHGEVFFDVAKDAARPFVVQSRLGEVTVTGTRFNVRDDDAGMGVAVVSGSVNVATGSWYNKQAVNLTKGMKVRIDTAANMEQASQVDVATITAWQRGRIIVENMPLAQVVKELNRYLPMPAVLQAPTRSQYKITGTFDASKPETMMDVLPRIAPVNVYQLTDGRYRVIER
jgi:transmembrane sensor